jgi:hypothetical protein
MGDVFHRVGDLLQRGGWWGLLISVVLVIGSIALATAVIVGWRPDHFKGQLIHRDDAHIVRRVVVLVAKNVVGLLVFVAGLVMALPGIPGQGLLTMIIGITLLDFPGKRALERRLIGRPRVLRSINRLRHRFGREPLEMD